MSIPVPFDYLHGFFCASYGPAGTPFIHITPHVPANFVGLRATQVVAPCYGNHQNQVVNCDDFPPCVGVQRIGNSFVAITKMAQVLGQYILFRGGVVQILESEERMLPILTAFDSGAKFCYHVYQFDRQQQFEQGPVSDVERALQGLAGRLIAIPIATAPLPAGGGSSPNQAAGAAALRRRRSGGRARTATRRKRLERR